MIAMINIQPQQGELGNLGLAWHFAPSQAELCQHNLLMAVMAANVSHLLV